MSGKNTVPSRPYWEAKREELTRDWEKIKNNFFVTEKGPELPQLSRNINFHPWQEIVFQRKGGSLNYLQLLKKGCSIHIKPENKGKFTETKKRTGKTTEELTHSKNPITRKRAIFAQNAAKWHH